MSRIRSGFDASMQHTFSTADQLILSFPASNDGRSNDGHTAPVASS